MLMRGRCVVLFHSGAGSTRAIAEIIASILDLELKEIGVDRTDDVWGSYDCFVLAFPVYHSYASSTMQEFIRGVRRFEVPKKVYVIGTCGLFEDNAVRHFYGLCAGKNILICGAGVYRGPATDGVLLLPPFKWMFEYGRYTVPQLKRDLGLIEKMINGEWLAMKKPRWKWYTALNYPNKKLGKLLKHRLKVDHCRCVACGLCVKNCVRRCISYGADGVEIGMAECENCFKCVHHCPTSAIVLSKKTPLKFKLTPSFYEGLKEGIYEGFKAVNRE